MPSSFQAGNCGGGDAAGFSFYGIGVWSQVGNSDHDEVFTGPHEFRMPKVFHIKLSCRRMIPNMAHHFQHVKQDLAVGQSGRVAAVAAQAMTTVHYVEPPAMNQRCNHNWSGNFIQLLANET